MPRTLLGVATLPAKPTGACNMAQDYPDSFVKEQTRLRNWSGRFFVLLFVEMIGFGVYSVFFQSAILMWNKTQEELVINNFIFATFIFTALAAYYFRNKADELVTEFEKT